jgi:hypothetical protein
MAQTPLPQLIESISGPGMWGHLVEFSRWTKHAASPGELESLAYIQAKLKDYGYATELVMHDAYISLPGAARVEHAGRTLPCISHSFSRSSPAGGLSAPAVHVRGGGAKDFASVDVRGKIVVVDGIASPAVSQRASRAGALGQLHVSPHQHVHEMCISPVWGSPTHESVHNLPSTVVVTVAQEHGAPIKAKLAAGEAVTLTLHAEVDTRWRKTPILIADLGSLDGGPDEPFVMFSGHHDTWYYGVMDNGGANATMLEVARLCAERRREWRRALRLIFWSGHSQGRYSSSSWYADQNWEELERRALVHVNIDSTGGKGNTVVADATSAAELRHLARAAIAEQGQQQHTGRRQSRAGDQAFWGIGVPAIFGNMSEQPAGGANASSAVFGTTPRLGHGTGWWWHTPDDLLDKMDEQNLVRDTRIYMQVLWRLLTDKVLPFDYAAHAVYLREELEKLQQAAGAQFDLGVLTQRARELEHLAGALNRRAASTSNEQEIARINQALVEVSRALVPVDYTECDRFNQDPALPQSAYPALQPVREFANLTPDSPEALFLTVGMMRARNRVAVALREANAALTRCLGDLGAKPN